MFKRENLVAGAAGAALLASAASFIAPFEGYRGKTYLDVVHVPTVCFGETEKAAVDKGRTYTFSRAECTDMLAKSLPKYDKSFRNCVKVAIPPSVYIAGLSFTYNVGERTLCKSTFARKANDGDFAGACQSLSAYVYAKGQVFKGLQNRRVHEIDKCMEDVR
jgi:lysozyme